MHSGPLLTGGGRELSYTLGDIQQEGLLSVLPVGLSLQVAPPPSSMGAGLQGSGSMGWTLRGQP